MTISSLLLALAASATLAALPPLAAARSSGDPARTYAPCSRHQTAGSPAVDSDIADRHSRADVAVLGALAGGPATADNAAGCDTHGDFYAYDQTAPYREPAEDGGPREERFDYAHYHNSGCRLVVATTFSAGGDQERFVRACPDSLGRYRLAD